VNLSLEVQKDAAWKLTEISNHILKIDSQN